MCVCVCVQFEANVDITTVVGGFVRRPNVTRVSYYFLVNDVPVAINGRFTIDPTSGRITLDGTGLTSDSFDPTYVRTRLHPFPIYSSYL